MNNPLFDLTGRRALVTGSSKGLGLSMARGLAQAGAAVIINARTESKVQAVVEQFTAEGLIAHGYAFDVADADAVKASVAQIEAEIGPIDILVNNAGIQHREPLEDFDEDIWQEIMNVNLTGIFLVTKTVGRGMIKRQAGKIINIGSLTSEVGRAHIVPYTTSKGGVKMFTKGLAAEWGKHNIQVNGIGPGFYTTEMNKALLEDEEFNAWVCRRTPAGRWGDPDELIGPVVFLASAASDFMNGQMVYVDGGFLAVM